MICAAITQKEITFAMFLKDKGLHTGRRGEI